MKLKYTQSRKSNIRNRKHLQQNQQINNAKKRKEGVMGTGGMTPGEFIKLFFGRK